MAYEGFKRELNPNLSAGIEICGRLIGDNEEATAGTLKSCQRGAVEHIRPP